MKTAYTYTILRYVHDPAAGESLNIGVVLLAPTARYLGARLQTNYGRLRKAFPSLDGDAHRDLMRYLQTRFDSLQEQMCNELAFETAPQSAGIIAAKVLPKDDSSLQWSEVGSGLSNDPSFELGRLYSRLVTANDSLKAEQGRGDDVVWSTFRAPLARDRVLRHLQPHKVLAENDEVEFDHAWKNHQWHCLQPFSLDLLDVESIKNKAHRVLGQMYGVREAVHDHILYLMVGEPQNDRCRFAAQKALNLLHKDLPIEHQIIRETDAEAFSKEFAAKVDKHIGSEQSF